MTVIVTPHGILGDLPQEIFRLKDLLVALEGIGSGLAPSTSELDEAPIIDHWVEATRPQLCLAGQIYGHPTVRGPLGITSEVWAMAPELGWVRTYSRFYRLGQQLSNKPY